MGMSDVPPSVKRRPVLRAMLFLGIMLALGWYFLARNQALCGRNFFAWATFRSRVTLQDAAGASREETERVLRRFHLVVDLSPDTVWAIQALEQMDAIYRAQARYDDARKLLEPICAQHERSADLCLMSRVYLGRSYEAEGALDQAAQTYLDMARWHPGTPLWIGAPLFPAQMYVRHHKPDQALRAFQQAKAEYLRRLKDAKDPNVVSRLDWELAAAHEGLQEWEQAAHVLEQAISTLGIRQPKLADMLFELGQVLETHLGRVKAAKSYYQRLLNEFPMHPLYDEAAARLRALQDSTR